MHIMCRKIDLKIRDGKIVYQKESVGRNGQDYKGEIAGKLVSAQENKVQCKSTQLFDRIRKYMGKGQKRLS